jgi:hypothetical protein
MSVAGLIAGTHALVVGVEDDEHGTRVYLDHRARGLYVVVEDEAAQREVRKAWAASRGHLTIAMPPHECVFSNRGEDA